MPDPKQDDAEAQEPADDQLTIMEEKATDFDGTDDDGVVENE